MSGVVDDWLSNEQFDFDVTTSPVGDNVLCIVNQSKQTTDADACLNDGDVDIADEDDEEVFFGPQTHKERCAAVVVKEEEAKKATPQALSAEQQALLLKESALLSVRIKHGSTPNTQCNIKNSPIAVVHPMPRQQPPKDASITNKENIPTERLKSNNQQSKLTQPIKSKANSKLLQPKFGSKARPSSQPESSSGLTKLPVSKVRRGTGPSSSTDSSEIVDKVSLYGLDKSSSSSTSSKPRRRSVNQAKANPTAAPPSSTSQQNKSQVPNLRPSALSTSRLKAPSSKSTSDMKLSTSARGPMRATASQSTIPSAVDSGVPRTNLKLQSVSRKSTASTGTPTRNSGIPSARRRSKIETPSASTTTSVPSTRPAITSRQSLITPVQRTPSSRRQMTARQLITKRRDSSRTPSPIEPVAVNNNGVERNTASPTPSLETQPTHETEDRIKKPSTEPPITGPPSAGPSSTEPPSTEPPSHSDIMNRYKRLMSSQKENKRTEGPSTDANEPKQDEITIKDESPVVETIHALPEAKLLEINDAASPLINMSPAKVTDYFLDPFHTGATPPPLIDVMDVLEPERPKEMNLIEF
ncbi:uncharacterized protein [Clytia hemisphaerica]|uniref:Uncharacterized protein n=1 Tax=Clytia hemisphaerica TaxID=252671 RepID=A0A7M5VBK9_9CNID